MMLCIDAPPRQRGGDKPADLSVPQHIGYGTFMHHDYKMGGNLFLASTSVISQQHAHFVSLLHLSIDKSRHYADDESYNNFNADDGQYAFRMSLWRSFTASNRTKKLPWSLPVQFDSALHVYISPEGSIDRLLYR